MKEIQEKKLITSGITLLKVNICLKTKKNVFLEGINGILYFFLYMFISRLSARINQLAIQCVCTFDRILPHVYSCVIFFED